ncbi:hypothetical protein TELCIR_19776, partial [Teladorsagia circumcincta]
NEKRCLAFVRNPPIPPPPPPAPVKWDLGTLQDEVGVEWLRRGDMISIILAITFLIFSYNEMMPRVSYIKAMDIYLGVCFMIVFLSLIKLAFVKYMRQRMRMERSEYVTVPVADMDDAYVAEAQKERFGNYSLGTFVT